MIGLAIEILLRSTWWIVYLAYCALYYLMYGKQETMDEKIAKRAELDKKTIEEMRNEIDDMKAKIAEMETMRDE